MVSLFHMTINAPVTAKLSLPENVTTADLTQFMEAFSELSAPLHNSDAGCVETKIPGGILRTCHGDNPAFTIDWFLLFDLFFVLGTLIILACMLYGLWKISMDLSRDLDSRVKSKRRADQTLRANRASDARPLQRTSKPETQPDLEQDYVKVPSAST